MTKMTLDHVPDATSIPEPMVEALVNLDCGGDPGEAVALLPTVQGKVALRLSDAPCAATTTLSAALSDYIVMVADARRSRERGEVSDALRSEARADRIYRSLPKHLRW